MGRKKYSARGFLQGKLLHYIYNISLLHIFFRCVISNSLSLSLPPFLCLSTCIYAYRHTHTHTHIDIGGSWGNDLSFSLPSLFLSFLSFLLFFPSFLMMWTCPLPRHNRHKQRVRIGTVCIWEQILWENSHRMLSKDKEIGWEKERENIFSFLFSAR